MPEKLDEDKLKDLNSRLQGLESLVLNSTTGAVALQAGFVYLTLGGLFKQANGNLDEAKETVNALKASGFLSRRTPLPEEVGLAADAYFSAAALLAKRHNPRNSSSSAEPIRAEVQDRTHGQIFRATVTEASWHSRWRANTDLCCSTVQGMCGVGETAWPILCLYPIWCSAGE